MDEYTWIHDVAAVDLEELSRLYQIAPLGDKPPEALATVFGNSMYGQEQRGQLRDLAGQLGRRVSRGSTGRKASRQ